MVFCIKCGFKNSDETKVYAQCGAPLHSTTSSLDEMREY